MLTIGRSICPISTSHRTPVSHFSNRFRTMASNTTFDFTPKSSSSMIPGLDVSYPSLPLSLLLVFLVCSFQSATLNSEKASTVNTPIREIADVNAATDGVGINFAVDCISEGTSTGNISQCFMEAERQAVGGVKRVVVAGKAAWVAAAVRKDVVPLYSVVWCSLGHELTYNGTILTSRGIWVY